MENGLVKKRRDPTGEKPGKRGERSAAAKTLSNQLRRKDFPGGTVLPEWGGKKGKSGKTYSKNG